MTSQRRKSARSRLFTLIRVSDGGPAMWAHDIGLGGMQVRSRGMRFPGTFLDLRFTLPGEDEELRVGAQITSVRGDAGNEFVLGLRYCNPTPHLKMQLFRFLDDRRTLWEDEPAVTPPKPPVEAVAPGPFENPFGGVTRPFEGLLLRAFEDLRQVEIDGGMSPRRRPSRELRTLSKILRAPGDYAQAG